MLRCVFVALVCVLGSGCSTAATVALSYAPAAASAAADQKRQRDAEKAREDALQEEERRNADVRAKQEAVMLHANTYIVIDDSKLLVSRATALAAFEAETVWRDERDRMLAEEDARLERIANEENVAAFASELLIEAAESAWFDTDPETQALLALEAKKAREAEEKRKAAEKRARILEKRRQAALEKKERERAAARRAAREAEGWDGATTKSCSKGCPCGNTCISCNKTCRK